MLALRSIAGRTAGVFVVGAVPSCGVTEVCDGTRTVTDVANVNVRKKLRSLNPSKADSHVSGLNLLLKMFCVFIDSKFSDVTCWHPGRVTRYFKRMLVYCDGHARLNKAFMEEVPDKRKSLRK
jgi:hypothetical protein